MSKLKITVTTVQHGFALEIGNKSWLLADEMKLAEAVVFRIGMGFTEPLSKKKVQQMLQTLAHGNGFRARTTRRNRRSKRVY